MALTFSDAKTLLERHNQGQLLRFWDALNEAQHSHLLEQIEQIQMDLMERLIDQWIRHEPSPETFQRIDPVPVIPPVDPKRDDAKEALNAGEAALRAGRVGIIMVAGGQGTRLGFEGPKGAYPIGPVTEQTLFGYHAEKIHNLQRRYETTLPWYIMVSEANEQETRVFFAQHDHFGLDPENITFFRQRMMPCVNEQGKFMLDAPGHLATNPNGHGGCIPALKENGILDDCRRRGVDALSYFQVDNWAVKVADPYFIGYHVLRDAEMSSKVHRKTKARESVGVHCICDGEYRVIEYSELDLYPQLLETDHEGTLLHFAGNPAIHIFDTTFIERVYDEFDNFPWHRAHKKVPYINDKGHYFEPESPNAYKFETFIFDALRFTTRPPVSLEIEKAGEYTPIKQFEGDNSVMAARRAMAEYWAEWLEEAGASVPRNEAGEPIVNIEISPAFALTKDEFVKRASERELPAEGHITITPEGEVKTKKED